MSKKKTVEKVSPLHKYCEYSVDNQVKCKGYKRTDYDNFITCIYNSWSGHCMNVEKQNKQIL